MLRSREMAAALIAAWIGGPALGADPLAEAPTPATLAPGDVFRDCQDCPLMTVAPVGGGAQPAVAIGVGAVTFAEWAACAATGAYCQSNPTPGDPSWARGAHPAIFVSWADVTGPNGFLDWLNAEVDGPPYRLPSEAELTQAAAVGLVARYRVGGDIAADQVAAHGDADASGVWAQGPLTIGGAANPTGLHNVRGEAWEWAQDCWGTGAGDDCARVVLRAGVAPEEIEAVPAAHRAGRANDARSGSIGFRVARSLSPSDR